MRSATRSLVLALLPLLALLLGSVRPASASTGTAENEVGLPVLAYYYIWYTPTSWDRAKTDLPLLGRYASEQRSIMEKHVRTAQEAGINGFLVSWKSTPDLDSRLATLVDVAREHDFKLGIVYQGLDFYRRPLPPARVARDLRLFSRTYGDHPVFDLDLADGPLVVWSGTWEFSAKQVARVTSGLRRSLTILASQRSADEYVGLAPHVDGNAYYWSSLDPQRDVDAQERLDELGEAVHERDGLWVPSAAPGFDARLIGGDRVVPRRDGETLREEWRLAIDSAADMVGLVSWNEFSENSHIEPSQNNGNQTLRTLAGILSATIPESIAADSSFSPEGAPSFPFRALLLALVAVGLVPGSLLLMRRRQATAGGVPSGAGDVQGGHS